MEFDLKHTKSILFISLLSTAVVHAYIPSHVEHFKTYNACDNCDLTRIKLDQYSMNSGAKSNIKSTYLTGSYLSQIDFSNSSFIDVNFVKSYFYLCHFQKSTFSNVNFSFADLSGNFFNGSIFKKTIFDNANLENAEFSNTNLDGASFIDANLKKAIFLDSNITQEQLNQASSYACAILPDGSIYDNNGKIDC